MKLKAKIFNSNKPNANNVVYDAESLKHAVEEYNKKQRFALGGEYPPVNLNGRVEDLVGEASLEYNDGVVTATITLLNSKKDKVLKAFEECSAPIKVIPTCVANYESKEKPADHIMITSITCTCLPVDTGDDNDMFVAEKIEEDDD
jgi:hypothetical protein